MSAEVGTTAHPAFQLMLAVIDKVPEAVTSIFARAKTREELEQLTFALATLAAALWDAPCAACSGSAADWEQQMDSLAEGWPVDE